MQVTLPVEFADVINLKLDSPVVDALFELRLDCGAHGAIDQCCDKSAMHNLLGIVKGTAWNSFERYLTFRRTYQSDVQQPAKRRESLPVPHPVEIVAPARVTQI